MATKQQRQLAAECLANGGTHKETSKKVGVSQSTLTRWSADAEFLEVISDIQLKRVESANVTLNYEIAESLKVLAEIRDDRDTHPNARVKACAELLDRAGIVKISRSTIEVTKSTEPVDLSHLTPAEIAAIARAIPIEVESS